MSHEDLDRSVADIVREIIEQDQKVARRPEYRRILFDKIVEISNLRQGLLIEDLMKIVIRSVSFKDQRDPYLEGLLGYNRHFPLELLEDFALYIEAQRREEKLNSNKFTSLIDYFSRVPEARLEATSPLSRAVRKGLKAQYPNHNWDNMPIRWFHLDQLTQLKIGSAGLRSTLALANGFTHLRTLFVQIEHTHQLTTLDQLLRSIPSLKSFFIGKELTSLASLNIKDLDVLKLSELPNIDTFGFERSLGLGVHCWPYAPREWAQLSHLKSTFSNIKRIVFIDVASPEPKTYTTKWLKEQWIILNTIGSIKKFDTVEILEFSGDGLKQFDFPATSINADHIRIRSSYLTSQYMPKGKPVMNLEVLKRAFPKTKAITLFGVEIDTKKLPAEGNDWEFLHIISSTTISSGQKKQEPFTITINPKQDRSLKQIIIENSPSIRVAAESEHLMKIRRTPVLPLVLNWKNSPETSEAERALIRGG